MPMKSLAPAGAGITGSICPMGNWGQKQNVGLHFQLTEGFHSWVHMHGISMLNDLRSVMNCNLTGWDGGTVMGHADQINSIYNHPVDEWTVALRTYQMFTSAYTWPGLTDAEERLLFSPQFATQANGRAFELLMTEFSRFWNYRQEYAAEYFYVANHCWRFTHHIGHNHPLDDGDPLPILDYDLIDFIYSLKPEVRRDQMILRSIITKRLPRLAIIPYDKQEYLPSVHPLIHNLQKAGLKAMKFAGLHPVRPQLYADYENYLRNELREWAEDILFSPQAAERYVQPGFCAILDEPSPGQARGMGVGKDRPCRSPTRW